ncbi:MAG: hypothetical protein HQ568_02405 [Calditrichaeota bacterium]|nr:hypothetical protein [Calditrichota bacterium]
MRFILVVLASLFFWSSSLFALNMERFGSHDPDYFVHSLDVELYGDLALVTGYGGLMIYDISEDIEYLNRYLPGGGRGVAVYNCCASNDVAYVTARGNGMYIVDISNPRSPELITRWQADSYSLEDAACYDNRLIVSAHQDGLFIYDVTDPRQAEGLYTFDELENSWEIALDDEGRLFIADGEGGLVIMNVAEEPEILSRMETSGNAIDVKVSGELCAVAVGADGVDLFDVSDHTEPVFMSNFDTPTYAGHIGFDGDKIAVADWDEVLVYDLSNPEEPFLDGRYYTDYRAMGVDISGDNIYLADWSKFIGFAHGEIDGADIAFSTRRIVPIGDDTIDTSLYVYNYGQSELEVTRLSCNAGNFEADPERFNLASGDSLELSMSFRASANASYPLRFQSNDTDDPNSSITLESSGGLSVEDDAPDFSARILGGGNYRLSDMADRVQLIIFWASW